jgi:hypothetical protein
VKVDMDVTISVEISPEDIKRLGDGYLKSPKGQAKIRKAVEDSINTAIDDDGLCGILGDTGYDRFLTYCGDIVEERLGIKKQKKGGN